MFSLRMRCAVLAAATAIAAFVGAEPPIPSTAQNATCLAKDQVRQAPPTGGGSIVVQICNAGQPVASVGGVDLIDPSGGENKSALLAKSAVLAVHTTIGAPAAAVIDIESPGGVVTRIYGGARLSILAQTDRSESYGARTGQIGFDVPAHRLDFMNVVTQALVAIVKGTDFDVTVSAEGARLGVAHGVVAAGRGIHVKIDSDNKLLDCIRIMELVNAGGSVTYSVVPELKEFADRAAARTYFQQQYAAAVAGGDRSFVDDASANLKAVESESCPPANPTPASGAAATPVWERLAVAAMR